MSTYRTLAEGDEAKLALARVWHHGPCFEPIASEGDRWIIGRDALARGRIDDRMSRRHCEVRRLEEGWRIADLGSANGTCVNGQQVTGEVDARGWRTLQVGRSLIVPLSLQPGVPLGIAREGHVFVGPGLFPVRAAIVAHAAQDVDVVLAGPRSCGFEALASHYLASHRRGGRLTVVSMHHFPEKLGHIPPGVVLVTETVLSHIRHEPRLLAALARRDLRFCFAVPHVMVHDPSILPDELAGRAALVVVPGLERRPEEVPWWIVDALAPGRAIDITFVEACVLGDWPGGVRGLVGEVRRAAGFAGDRPLRARHLDPDPLLLAMLDRERPRRPARPRQPPPSLRDREAFAALLERVDGDHARAAKRLGVAVEAIEQWVRRHRLGEAPGGEEDAGRPVDVTFGGEDEA